MWKHNSLKVVDIGRELYSSPAAKLHGATGDLDMPGPTVLKPSKRYKQVAATAASTAGIMSS